MTESILARVVWKEYRLLRGFFAAMLLATILLQLLILWGIETPSNTAAIFMATVAVTACYALGCGATAFAAERENGTAMWQCVLPAAPRQVLLGKAAFGAISSLALGTVTWLLGELLVRLRWEGLTGDHLELAELGLFKSLEFLVWGLFFSLLIPRPLRALGIAGVAATLVLYVLSLITTPAHDITWFYFPSFLGEPWTMIPRGVILLVVGGAMTLRLAQRWYFEDEQGSRTAEPESEAEPIDHEQADRRFRRLAGLLTRSAARHRLYWQSLVRSRRALGITILAYVVAAVLLGSLHPDPDPDVVNIFVYLLIPVAGFCGVLAFAEDQSRDYFRFFAEHGVSPRKLWLSRQLFWLGFSLLLSLVVCVAVSLTVGVEPNRLLGWRNSWDFGTLFVLILLAYAVGQLCSLWITSTIVATGTAIVMFIPLLAWSLLMFALRVNLWGAVVPLPLFLLLATWATADQWLKERHGWAIKLQKTLWVTIPAALVVLFAIEYRVREIPEVPPQFMSFQSPMADFSAAQLKAGEETGRLYRELHDQLEQAGWSHKLLGESDVREWKKPADIRRYAVLTPESRQWLSENQELVARAVALAEREDAGVLPEDSQHSMQLSAALQSSWLVTFSSAHWLREQGDLGAALTQYLAALRIGRQISLRHVSPRYSPLITPHGIYIPHGIYQEQRILHSIRMWAEGEEQTPELIRRALDELREIWQRPLYPELALKNLHHACLRDWHDGTQKAPDSYFGKYGNVRRYWVYALMPWEYERARRLAFYAFHLEFTSLRKWQRKLARQSAGLPTDPIQFSNEPGFDQIGSWQSNTWGTAITHRLARRIAERETNRRGTELVLALHGWKLEHGRLPKTLDPLVPEWFPRLPVAPATGTRFTYYPEGHGKSWRRSGGYPGFEALPLRISSDVPGLTAPSPLTFTIWFFPLDYAD